MVDVHDRHFYLYAKHWYKRSDNILNDLLKLQAEYTGVSTEHLIQCDVEAHLLRLIYKQATIDEYRFLDFMSRVQKDGIIKACLSFMCTTMVKDIGFDIGKPDPKILSLRDEEEVKKKNVCPFN